MAGKRISRSEEHARQVEQNQSELRVSIAETQRLMDKADEMLARHRRERESDEDNP